MAITPGGRVGDDTPVGKPGGKKNWVDKAGGLPKYMRMVAHALIRNGKSESHAIAIAVATMKRWAAGGGNVSAKVRAAAAAALSEWEAKRGASHVSKRRMNDVVELLKAEVSPIGKEMLETIRKEFGAVPMEDLSAEHVSRAARALVRLDPDNDGDIDQPYYPGADMDADEANSIMRTAADSHLKVAWADLHRQHTSSYGDKRSRVMAHKAKGKIEKEQQRRQRIAKSHPPYRFKHGWIPVDGMPGKHTLSAEGHVLSVEKNNATGEHHWSVREYKKGRGNAFHPPSGSGVAPTVGKAKKAAEQHFIEKISGSVKKKVRLTKREFDEAAALVNTDRGSVSKSKRGKQDVVMKGEISKVDNDQRLVFGWASVGIRKDGKVIVDKQEDFIDDPQEIEKAAYNFVLHSRDGGEMHIRKGVSTLVESFVITPEKREAMGIPEGVLPKAAWWTGWKVHDDEVWKGVKSGKYKMFSVHGKGTRKRAEV